MHTILYEAKKEEMLKVNNHKAQTDLLQGHAVIIDVRQAAEFVEHHIPGALNFPSTQYNKGHYAAFQHLDICLVCESGQRAQQIATKLLADGFEKVYVLEQQMQDIPKISRSNSWSVDRQFRMTLGLLLAIFLVLHYFQISAGLVIPVILSTGLIITSIIDRCYMRMGIAMLPWNKNKQNCS